MHTQHSPLYDVVIAGGGPVGLFLACELRLLDVSVVVLERADHPHSPLKQLPFGLRGLSVATLDAFYRRGLLDEVVAAQRADASADKRAASAHWMTQPRRPAGHFAGIPFYHEDIDPSQWPYRLPDASVASIAVTLATLEGVLARRARAMGAEIRRGFGVDAFHEADDHVTAYAGGETFCGRWLVGCDGGRSTIRKAAGFEFVGTEPEFTGYSVDVELADPDALQPGRHATPGGMFTYARPGTIAMADFDGGAGHRREPLTLDHVQAVLRRVSGTALTLTGLRLATTWTDRACQVTAYRKGRVLLAGDAAHIHSPLGGQGLNLGLGDAMNLGWKLAATIRGDAPAGLLDSYHTERHPVGASVLDASRAQVALMRPTESARALAAIVRDLIGTRDGATYFAGRVWGVSLRYAAGGGHPLVGYSVPDFALADGTTVGSLLRAGKGLLLDFDADPAREALAHSWRRRVAYVAHVAHVACSAAKAADRPGWPACLPARLRAMLVRPDGFVAWASEAEPDAGEIAQAVSHWFGEADAEEGAPE